jgi:hypothetical protein
MQLLTTAVNDIGDQTTAGNKKIFSSVFFALVIDTSCKLTTSVGDIGRQFGIRISSSPGPNLPYKLHGIYGRKQLLIQ